MTPTRLQLVRMMAANNDGLGSGLLLIECADEIDRLMQLNPEVTCGCGDIRLKVEMCHICGKCQIGCCDCRPGEDALQAEVDRLTREVLNLAGEIARQCNAASKLEAETARLKEALEFGYKLSTWAAAINWDARGTNTTEFLSELQGLIETFQPMAESALQSAKEK